VAKIVEAAVATLMVTEGEFRRVANVCGGKYEYNAQGFVLISFGAQLQNHIRLDLVKWEGGRFNKIGGGRDYEFLVSSFHVKRETYYSRDEQDYDYLYFAYYGGGVWQPIWGYNKTETRAGRGGRRDSDDDGWAEGTTIARLFLEDLSRATGTDQGLAMGPIQGTEANLFGQL
jgi:hypothetical protein